MNLIKKISSMGGFISRHRLPIAAAGLGVAGLTAGALSANHLGDAMGGNNFLSDHSIATAGAVGAGGMALGAGMYAKKKIKDAKEENNYWDMNHPDYWRK